MLTVDDLERISPRLSVLRNPRGMPSRNGRLKPCGKATAQVDRIRGDTFDPRNDAGRLIHLRSVARFEITAKAARPRIPSTRRAAHDHPLIASATTVRSKPS